MADFLLVHGAWHGGWCWDAVARGLTERGHRATAIDLPGHDRPGDHAHYGGLVEILDDLAPTDPEANR